MPEVRQTIPYISRLKYTIRPTTRFDPVRQLENGDWVGYRNYDLPGIGIEVTPYFGTIAMDREYYEFKSKSFLQSEHAKLSSIENPTPDQVTGLANLNLVLANHKLWLEDLLAEAGIADLEGDWAQAFSDALDSFPQWKEPDPNSADPAEAAAAQFKGIPAYIPQIRWDAVIPWAGSKHVEVTVGLYKKADYSDTPVEETLKFEDGDTRRVRESEITRNQAEIAVNEALLLAIEDVRGLRAIASPTSNDLAALEGHYSRYNGILRGIVDLDAFKAQVNVDLTNRRAHDAQLRSASYGNLAELLGHVSVSTSVYLLIMAALKALKGVVPEWSELDLATVASRYQLPQVG